MKRILSIAGSLLGLLVLGVLAVALALTFSGLGRGAEPASQAFQSPIETPTQLPYPIPATPTHPPLKPTPVTPPPTIPPKPSPPMVTVTLPPYPPPQTPTLPGTPTSVPTPRATVTPPAPGTPTAVPTPSGLLPPGLKVVYGETDSLSGTTTIWLASAMNPTLRRVLATFAHKVGYGVQGAVSPDGDKIACLVIPPDASERAARTAGGELWVMSSDGRDPHTVADRVGWISPLTIWSPDNRTLVFGRRIPVESPMRSQVPLRTELYVVTTDMTGPRLLLSEDIAHDIQPVGWSADGHFFYYAKWANLQDRWELWKIDVRSGLMHFQTVAPSANAQSPLLSPDGTKVIFTALEGGKQTLIMLSVDGQEQRTLISGATGDRPIDQYIAIWSPDAQSIFAHIPPPPGQPAHLERIDLRTGQRHVIPIEPICGEEFLIPQAWSPDGKWLVVLKYPRFQSLAYLMQATGGPMTQIPLTQSSDWVSLFGWTDRR